MKIVRRISYRVMLSQGGHQNIHGAAMLNLCSKFFASVAGPLFINDVLCIFMYLLIGTYRILSSTQVYLNP